MSGKLVLSISTFYRQDTECQSTMCVDNFSLAQRNRRSRLSERATKEFVYFYSMYKTTGLSWEYIHSYADFEYKYIYRVCTVALAVDFFCTYTHELQDNKSNFHQKLPPSFKDFECQGKNVSLKLFTVFQVPQQDLTNHHRLPRNHNYI